MQKLTFTLLLATAGMALGTISAPNRTVAVSADAVPQATACCDEPPPPCWPIPCDEPPSGKPAEPPKQ